jgi:hypothetical protein
MSPVLQQTLIDPSTRCKKAKSEELLNIDYKIEQSAVNSKKGSEMSRNHFLHPITLEVSFEDGE